MKKLSLFLIVLLLAGCAASPENTAPPQTVATVPPEPGLDIQSVPIAHNNTAAGGRLRFLEQSRYTGGFLEDGSGVAVENVAALLVRNDSQQYLHHSVLTFRVGDSTATFKVTGLPPGASCWVLEQNRLQIDAAQRLEYQSEAHTIFAPVERVTELDVELLSGSLIVRNISQESIRSAYIYYKELHTDGNYLGGITYRCLVGSMKPGTQQQLNASHSTPGFTRVVRIERSKEETT